VPFVWWLFRVVKGNDRHKIECGLFVFLDSKGFFSFVIRFVLVVTRVIRLVREIRLLLGYGQLDVIWRLAVLEILSRSLPRGTRCLFKLFLKRYVYDSIVECLYKRFVEVLARIPNLHFLGERRNRRAECCEIQIQRLRSVFFRGVFCNSQFDFRK